MCLLSVSVRHKLVSCCLIVIKRSIRCVKLLLLAVTQELMLFRWWLFHVGHFPVSLSDAKTSKGQSSVAMYACKIFLHFSGVGWGGGEKLLSFFAYISHLSRKQFKELCFGCLLNSFWCSFSGWNPFWNEIQLKFFRINIYQFVKIWSKAVNVKALWSYSWSISRFLGHLYSSSSHFEPSLILPFCTQFAEKLRCEDYALLQDSLTNIIKHGVKTAVNNFSFSYTSMVVRNLIVTVSDMAFK